MLKFVFVVVLASTPFSNVAISLNNFPLNFIQEARTGDFHELCRLFCGNQSLSFHFRGLDNTVQPRIFCGLCRKKLTTTPVPTSVTTSSSTTSASTTGAMTSLAPTTGASTSLAPTTGASTSLAPTTMPPTTPASTSVSSSTAGSSTTPAPSTTTNSTTAVSTSQP